MKNFWGKRKGIQARLVMRYGCNVIHWKSNGVGKELFRKGSETSYVQH